MAEMPKRSLRRPKRLIEEICVPARAKKNNSVVDNNLYEVEVKEVDQEKKLLLIHYKGYSDAFDEWRPFGSEDSYFPFIRQEKLDELSEDSLDDRAKYLKGKLYREIKRELYSSKRSDPAVRIEIDASDDAFKRIANSFNSARERGREVYHVASNRLLDDTLGTKWDERIFNKCVDFAYVIDGTVKFWLGKKSPIIEYKHVGGKLIQSEIENNTQLVFTFVRGDGNSRQYAERQ